MLNKLKTTMNNIGKNPRKYAYRFVSMLFFAYLFLEIFNDVGTKPEVGYCDKVHTLFDMIMVASTIFSIYLLGFFSGREKYYYVK